MFSYYPVLKCFRERSFQINFFSRALNGNSFSGLLTEPSYSIVGYHRTRIDVLLLKQLCELHKNAVKSFLRERGKIIVKLAVLLKL